MQGNPEDRQRQWAAGQRKFPAGRRMAVLEPFYKVATDGSLGVRVDNPREVVWLDDLGPSDADGCRAEGAQTLIMLCYDSEART